MINSIESGLAGKILIGLSSGLIGFHIINMLGLIPVNVTWLGRVDADRTMLFMRLLSIFLNLIVIMCALVKCNYVSVPLLTSIIVTILPFVFWWLVGNTIANLFSKSIFEVVIFTPILVILTFCFYIMKTKSVS